MSDPTLEAAFRPLAEELITDELVRTQRTVRRITRGGQKVDLGSGTVGNLPGNRHGPIADESVVVSLAALPTIASQEALNEYLLAVVAALAGGQAAASPDYYYVRPHGDDGTDPEWLTRNGRVYRRRRTA